MIRFISFTLSLLLILSLCSCNFDFTQNSTTEPPTDEEIIAEQSEILKIGFLNIESKEDENDIEEILTVEELKSWVNPYGKYSSYILYSQLTEDEKLVYKALEYGLVNSYESIAIDYRINVTRPRMEEIAELLSLDTPLLEQNIYALAGVYTGFYDYEYSEDRTIEILHRANTVYVTNFKSDLWELKLKAIEEAEKIVSSFDKDLTETQLAEEIYRYIAKNVKYTPYENEYGHYKGSLSPFLYDAIVKKESHCDGYANALALLYSVAGFEQVEKHNRTEIGHTWNCVKIDDKWYNIDGTGGDWIIDNTKTMGQGLLYCFSDELQDEYPNHYEIYPDCPESMYISPGAYLSSCNDRHFSDTVYKNFIKNKMEWALIILDKYTKDDLRTMSNNLYSKLGFSFVLITKRVHNNKTAVLILRKDIYSANINTSV